MEWSLFAHNLPYLLMGPFPDGPLGGAALTLVLALTSAFASALAGIAGGVALALSRGVVRMMLLLVIGFFSCHSGADADLLDVLPSPHLVAHRCTRPRDRRVCVIADWWGVSRTFGLCGHCRGR